jgi:hypothetical protein
VPRRPKKDPTAVTLGRKGGMKSGKARMTKLTPEQRSAVARTAARARWAKAKRKKGAKGKEERAWWTRRISVPRDPRTSSARRRGAGRDPTGAGSA